MYGTPVIGSRMGGIPELIREEKTGLMFEAGNVDDLEEKLRYLLETPTVLEAYTDNCKAVSFETPQTYYQQILKLYGE
jgi:glycosyltransferase involved in cell wall biosynthesis